jgi:hypothetical protein
MQANVEDAIKIIKNLPVEDYDKIRKVLDENESKKRLTNGRKENVGEEIVRFKKSQKWLDENRDKYMNEWVCLDGDKLIAHGKDALEVDRKAKEAGIEAPFLEHIVEEKYPFGGW